MMPTIPDPEGHPAVNVLHLTGSQTLALWAVLEPCRGAFAERLRVWADERIGTSGTVEEVADAGQV